MMVLLAHDKYNSQMRMSGVDVMNVSELDDKAERPCL